ncbi:MAG TPA: hypothetical protein VIC33_00295 [Vicinamibacterales bacterium]
MRTMGAGGWRSVAALLFACLLASPAAAADADHLTRTLPVPPHTPIAVAITEGTITITGEARSDLAIDIVRRARNGKSTDLLPLVAEKSADGIQISALQPAQGDQPGHDPDLQADVTIHAPADAVFSSVTAFEGRITLTNLRGAITADITRGPIEATGVSGQVRLTGHLGDVTVQRAQLTPGGLLRLRTFNGNVRLALAKRPANARVLAVTYNGQISSLMPLQMKTRFGPNFGEASIGSGEPLISIDVVRGDIQISAPKAPTK